jgi:hypothetical protein
MMNECIRFVFRIQYFLFILFSDIANAQSEAHIARPASIASNIIPRKSVWTPSATSE